MGEGEGVGMGRGIRGEIRLGVYCGSGDDTWRYQLLWLSAHCFPEGPGAQLRSEWSNHYRYTHEIPIFGVRMQQG